jgi:Icc-related predicted phosphoesterase
MRLVCVSDTHWYPVKDVSIPDGDVLIHAGDLTGNGTFMQIRRAGEWLTTLPHKHKIVVAGNHDFLFEKDYNLARHALGDGFNGIQYLQDHVTVIDGVVFYGAPWSVYYNDWAFGLHPGREAKSRWDRIPDGIDVLVTHGPPKGIMDEAPNGYSLGCEELLQAVRRIKPRLHVFGHIHHSHGVQKHGDTLFVNAAICDEDYKHTQEPIVLDYRASGIMQIRPKRRRP